MEWFGRYLLLDRIGCGGMAEVFRALSIGSAGFAKTVAIKRVLPNLAADPAAVTMLISEAKLAASLHHPAIVPIIDLGEESGSYFIAMDYVAGRTLHQMVNRARELGEKLPVACVLNVTQQILGALSYAHQRKDESGEPRNIIHRDISPDNIMVGYEGNVILMDFGVARATDAMRSTVAGTLKGKPAYMCPEIVNGAAVTQSVDLYAMGVVLHEALTHQSMRPNMNDLQMLTDVAKGNIPTFEERGVTVPGPVADVVYRALARSPADRFADASAFAAHLAEAAKTLDEDWNQAKTAALMSELFEEEAAEERSIQARIQKLVTEQGSHVRRGASLQMPNELVDGAPPGRSGALKAAALLVVTVAAAASVAWYVRGIPGNVVEDATVVQSASPPPLPVVHVEEPVAEPPGEGEVSAPSSAAQNAPEARPKRRGHPAARRPGPVAPRVVQQPDPAPSVPVGAVSVPKEPAEAPRVAEPAIPARLTLQSKPWGRIIIDGKDTGRFTPVRDLALAAGQHTIQIINKELKMGTRFVVIAKPGAALKEARTLTEVAGE